VHVVDEEDRARRDGDERRLEAPGAAPQRAAGADLAATAVLPPQARRERQADACGERRGEQRGGVIAAAAPPRL
jgi:hypothetical protein